MITNDMIRSGFPSGSLDEAPLDILPLGTIIKTIDGDRFERDQNMWVSMDDHCGECGTLVMDNPDHQEDPNGYPRIFANSSSYFKDGFIIVSVPYISEKELRID